MGFEELNSSQDKAPKSREEIIKELKEFAEREGNLLTFLDYGEDISLPSRKEFDEYKFDEPAGLKNFVLFALRSYLAGPTFTDTFTNHADRTKWELRIKDLMGEELLDYYQSNKLGYNKCYAVIQILTLIMEETEKQDLDMQSRLANVVKQEVAQKFLMSTSSVAEYNTLSNDDKIEIVNKLTQMVKDVIDLLTEKK